VNEPSNESVLDKQLSLKLVLGWGFTVLVAAMSGTAYLVSTMNSSQVNALSVQLDAERNRTEGLKERSTSTSIDTQNTETGAAEVLSARIATLEHEKQSLVSQLAEISRGALSPDSELGGLIQQLQSNEPARRIAAATGLFELRDARAVDELIGYFWRDPAEATRAANAADYMRFVWQKDRGKGIDFVLSVLQANNELHSRWAYEHLSEVIWDKGVEDGNDALVSALENVALRSQDPLARTRAKLLLQSYAERQEHRKNQ